MITFHVGAHVTAIQFVMPVENLVSHNILLYGAIFCLLWLYHSPWGLKDKLVHFSLNPLQSP